MLLLRNMEFFREFNYDLNTENALGREAETVFLRSHSNDKKLCCISSKSEVGKQRQRVIKKQKDNI